MKDACKTALLTIASGIMLLMVFCMPAFATESEEQTYNKLLIEYKGSHQEITLGLEHVRKTLIEIINVSQEIRKIDELINKKNQKPEYYKKYQEKRDALENSLIEKYGISILIPTLHFENFRIAKESKEKSEKVLNDTISRYIDTLDCFEQKTYSGSKSCEDFTKSCGNYGSDNGDMYYYELTNELELKKIDVSEIDTNLFERSYKPLKGEDTFLRDTYQFCRLLSLTSSPFSPNSIRKESGIGLHFIEGFYGSVIPYPSIFQKRCIDGKPSEQRVERLLALKFQFPENWTIKKYYDDYEKWQSACEKTAQKICKNTYVIKDQIILTYSTVACKNREVTKEDIESDIRSFDSNAEKLKHSTLFDEIDLCQKAHDNGFSWLYEEPTPSDKCKKEAPQTPKKKK